MNENDNKGLNMQLEDNEKMLYSDDLMKITNKRFISNGVTFYMQVVKSAWVGGKKIPIWPGVLLLLWGLYLFYPFLAYRADYNLTDYSIFKYKYLITACGIGYFYLRQKIAKFAVYVSGINNDSDKTAIVVSKDMDYLNTVLEAINKAIAT